MSTRFSRFLDIDVPAVLTCEPNGKNPAFGVAIRADGRIPFPQLVLRQHGREHLIKDDRIRWLGDAPDGTHRYRAEVPGGLLSSGQAQLQIEGCQQTDLRRAGSEDWIKALRELVLRRAATPPRPASGPGAAPRIESAAGPVHYFGIHKHMHQPFYDAADSNYWDGEKEEIFGSRAGPYTEFVAAAIQQYAASGLPHAGLSCSWSGSLIEQLELCAAQGRAGGRFRDWTTNFHQRPPFTRVSSPH